MVFEISYFIKCILYIHPPPPSFRPNIFPTVEFNLQRPSRYNKFLLVDAVQIHQKTTRSNFMNKYEFRKTFKFQGYKINIYFQ